MFFGAVWFNDLKGFDGPACKETRKMRQIAKLKNMNNNLIYNLQKAATRVF